jgi:aflatoxin B1 aldehyde reductase
MYKGNPKMADAVEKISKIADDNGISAIELALRWVVHDSPLQKGDGVILGARNEEQLVQNVEAIKKGKLPESVVKELDVIWEGVKDVAPGDL